MNKGSAFTVEERASFNLMGLLPPRYETIEEQVDRAYMQFSSFHTNLKKLVYLRAILDTNETLFFRLVKENLVEMMPIIYTPTVGDACERFSDIYHSPRGLFVSHKERHKLDDILRNATKNKVKIIVVTDGERVLGLGDQGIGGMGIPIGKLALYTACGGISPAYTLPVFLDIGTNNEKLLNDPRYVGLRHKRIEEDQYYEFVDMFIRSVKSRWPRVLLQFEDFAQAHATPLLTRYRDEICCFNDDIQGTAAVTVGTLLAACRIKREKLSDQKVVFVGAGSAGCGIAEQIITQMASEGISPEQARSQIYMVDRSGLLTEGMGDLRDFQERLVQRKSALQGWEIAGEYASLLEVVNGARPDILIGVAGVPGLFTEQAVKAMKSHCATPIIFPLSNPVRQAEATPEQVINWTGGEVIVATGSPFEPVEYKGEVIRIAQCNNSYIFPGLGLGVVAANANRITDEMLMAASETLAHASPRANAGAGDLLPPLEGISTLSKKIAFAVAKVAFQQGHALEMDDEMLEGEIQRNFWEPEYRHYKRISR